MGVAGSIIPPVNYFLRLQELLVEHDIQLIADEVICGFMRTGSFWGAETTNMRPNVVVASKCMTAGYFPMGATVFDTTLSERLMSVCRNLDEFPHGHTTSGHPVGCEISLRVIEMLTDVAFLDRYSTIEKKFMEKLENLRNQGSVHEIRTTGLLAGIDLQNGPSDSISEPFDTRQMLEVNRACRQRNLICRMTGNTVMLAPPYIINGDDLNYLFSTLEQAIELGVSHAS